MTNILPKDLIASRSSTSVLVRVFRAVYVPDLDHPSEFYIPMGMFGDLRLGDRFALGLIARRAVDNQELDRVGRLAKELVQSPFTGLKSHFDRIWRSADPAAEFDQLMGHTGSSLWFEKHSSVQEDIGGYAKLFTTVEETRAWCKGRLRRELRRSYNTWINDEVSETPDQAEQIRAFSEAA